MLVLAIKCGEVIEVTYNEEKLFIFSERNEYTRLGFNGPKSFEISRRKQTESDSEFQDRMKKRRKHGIQSKKTFPID